MSFLENAATLDEALAFIDSCSEHSSNAGSGGDSSPARSCSSPDVEPAQAPQASDAKEKEKKRRASGYSMKVQRRKKQELATLRDQAKVLEAELGRWKQLQSATQPQANALTSGPHQAPATAKQDWHRTAIVQLQERQRAEKTNRKLLELLKKKARVNDAVRRVLQKSSTIPGLEGILGSPRPTARHPLAGLDHSRVLLSQLEGAVESMRVDCGFMLAPTEPRSVSTTMTTKQMDQGSLVEITTTTPMACSMQAAGAWLWENLATLREYPDKAYNYLRQSTPDTVEKNYVMTLRGRPFSLQVNGLQLLRKYEEPDRVLLVRSNHLLLPTEGLHFRNNCWTSVTPAASNPHGASIVRTCVQLYADCKDGLAISPRDLEGVKDLALDSLSGMYRKHAQMMQNALIEERGGIATAV